jgi:hypothetical protein
MSQSVRLCDEPRPRLFRVMETRGGMVYRALSRKRDAGSTVFSLSGGTPADSWLDLYRSMGLDPKGLPLTDPTHNPRLGRGCEWTD